MSQRFTVRRTLPNLWEVCDAWTLTTEFVLFADIGINHARLWAADELLTQPDGRGQALRMLADRATRAGVRHTFRAPPAVVTTDTFHDEVWRP